jgi:hypothetical protein
VDNGLKRQNQVSSKLKELAGIEEDEVWNLQSS